MEKVATLPLVQQGMRSLLTIVHRDRIQPIRRMSSSSRTKSHYDKYYYPSSSNANTGHERCSAVHTWWIGCRCTTKWSERICCSLPCCFRVSIYFGTLQAELLGFPQFPNPLEQDGQTDQTNRSLKKGEKHSDHGKRR